MVRRDAGEADRRAVGRRPGRISGGHFPSGWSEWNGNYRDSARLLARRRGMSATSRRGSPLRDLYQPRGREPSPRSTSSPPTTALRCRTSSPTTTSTTRPTARTTATEPMTTALGTAASRADLRPGICELRARQQRNFMTTLLLSHGVPMILGGDEFSRTQQGTTTPGARTTRSLGSTGIFPTSPPSSANSPAA